MTKTSAFGNTKTGKEKSVAALDPALEKLEKIILLVCFILLVWNNYFISLLFSFIS